MMQVLRETTTDYNSFVNEITGKVKKMMGEEYSVQIYKVTKNNSMELDSLVLLKQGKNFAPNIYLLPYYEAYVEGISINELAQRLCDIYKNCTIPIVAEEFTYSFEEMKPYIIYRLVSFDRNKKLLEQVPHIKYLDLAITFHCLVRDDDDGIGTIRITNEHMLNWRTSLQELQVLATGNTKILFPSTIRSMDEVIKGMLTDEMFQSGDDFKEDILAGILGEKINKNQHKMYILSNLKGINGASCLLYEDVLREFARQIQSDFYILPSSIHEIILVPFDKTMKKESLAEMVKDVNRTQVAREEVLSDRVYYFSRKNNAITM
ncbi:MAG: hypothetical protein K0S01_522 [Herbinix sp.]|jgi:hypothetical protein|nr:hypothetical protein [Herbinix sp.]